MSTPSATLTVWAAAWLAGRTAPDDMLAALHAWAPRQFVVAGDPVTGDRLGVATRPADYGLSTLLRTLRSASTEPTTEFRLLLPVPGDVRGIPAGTAFAADAIAAGEGLLIGTPGSDGIGLVPMWTEDDDLGWTVYSVPMPTNGSPEQSLGEAEYAMRQAVREAADALVRLQGIGVFGADDDPREAVEAELAEYSRHLYPLTTSLRARRVLDTADHVAAILAVAQRAPSRTPISASGTTAQDDLFRPLWEAIRTARLVAVREAVRPE